MLNLYLTGLFEPVFFNTYDTFISSIPIKKIFLSIYLENIINLLEINSINEESFEN